MTELPGLQWTPGEAATVNDFLNSGVGRKWLNYLWLRKPKMGLADLTSGERAGLTGAFSAGYEFFFNIINESRTVLPQIDPSTKGIDPTKD